MANTAGGPFGGLLNSPELWDKLLQSFGSIGRYLSAPPGPSLGENALRDVGQIGVTAPLGVPGAIGLSAFGEGMRPPWEQSPLRVPERGLETASDLSKLALRDPMMLQKLATSALLGGPSAFQQAFHEHPVLTPLMAIPFLSPKDIAVLKLAKDTRMSPGTYSSEAGKSLLSELPLLLHKIWPMQMKEGPHQRTAAGLVDILRDAINRSYDLNALEAAVPNPKHGQIVTTGASGTAGGGKQFVYNSAANEWQPLGASPELDLAAQRIAARERRIRRKLTQHEVEDVIAQAMSERTATPATGAPPSQSAQVSKEELLHQFEEGPGGPLPPITTGKEPPPPPSPEEIGGQMLRNEGWTPGEMGLARPVQPEPPPDIFDVVREAKGIEFPWQQRVQQLLDNEWRRVPKTGPMSGPPDVRFGTNFLNTYAGAEPVGTKFSYKGQDFMRLKRGWSYIPRGEGPTTAGELSKQVTGGSDLLGQVPLEPKKQNWQQSVVAKLNAFGAGASQEWWENGQRFVKGPKGWMLDQHMFIPPIQHIQGQTLLPHPEGAIGRYLKANLWDPFDRLMSNPRPQAGETEPQRFIQNAMQDLERMTGNKRVAQFWLMQHIHERQLAGKATPAEIVWFELQRGQRPPDEGMAGAKR